MTSNVFFLLTNQIFKPIKFSNLIENAADTNLVRKESCSQLISIEHPHVPINGAIFIFVLLLLVMVVVVPWW